jgi:hypothetical protein
MSKVVLSIPKLGVTERGWEHNKEIYVISFTSDLAKVSDAPKLPDGSSPRVAVNTVRG